MKPVTIYSTNYCPYCRQAERLLTSKGVAYTSVDVTDDPAMREKLVELSGGRKTVPQIFIDGVSVGGYSDLVALDQKKQLDPMLGIG